MCDRIDLLRRIKELEKENERLKEELKCAETNFQTCNDDLAALGELVGGSCFDETYDLVKQLVDKIMLKPYKFEEFHEGMWVWDDIEQICYQIGFDEDSGHLIYYFYDDGLYNIMGFADLKFEENRFYPPNKANEVTDHA